MTWTVAAFGGSWLALLLVSLWEGKSATIRTAIAMLANWCAQVAFYALTAMSTAWWFFLPLDVVTARYVLRNPSGKLQGIVSFLLLAQIAFHAAYGINEMLNGYSWGAEMKYWTFLTGIAALQAVSVGGGIGGGFLVRLYRRRFRRDHAMASAADLASAGRG